MDVFLPSDCSKLVGQRVPVRFMLQSTMVNPTLVRPTTNEIGGGGGSIGSCITPTKVVARTINRFFLAHAAEHATLNLRSAGAAKLLMVEIAFESKPHQSISGCPLTAHPVCQCRGPKWRDCPGNGRQPDPISVPARGSRPASTIHCHLPGMELTFLYFLALFYD
jgi:hypothetical protein